MKAAGQSGILFKVLFVFRPGRGGDGAKFSTGESRFQKVSGITSPCGSPGSDERVGFVNEENDRFRRGLDLIDDGFEAIFKLSFYPGPGLKEPHVEAQDRNISEDLRDVSFHHS